MTQKALKLALDALETELSIDWTNNDEFNASAKKMYEAIAAIKEALAQTQEPVTWGVDWGKAGDISCVSIIKRLPNNGIEVVAVEYAPYSYTAPPEPTRVRLTDEVITQVINSMPKKMRGFMVDWDLYELARAIESKLKEKNT